MRRFGSLGLIPKIQARIAVTELNRRGVMLAYGARQHLLAACRQRRDDLLAVLLGNPNARKIFLLDAANNPRFQTDGIYPKRRDNQVQKWLLSILDSFLDRNDVPLPIWAGGKLPTMPLELRALHVIHPLLEAWIELMEVCALWKFLDGEASMELHPQYTLPALCTSTPSLGTICSIRIREPIFRHRDGKVFLVLRFEDLTLRALARILQKEYGDSCLANVFHQGLCPVTVIEKHFRTWADGNLRLPSDQWRQLAQVLIHHAPVGHSVDVILRVLNDVGIQAKRVLVLALLRFMKMHIVPGLAPYLRNPAIDLMEKTLGLAGGGLKQKWQEHTRKPFDADTFVSSFFRTLPQRYDARLVLEFIGACVGRGSSIIPAGNSVQLEDVFANLTSHRLVTAEGGVFGDATIWQSLGKAHLRLAELIRNAVVYELVRHNHAVCAVIGDTMLMEIDVPKTGVRATAVRAVESTIRPIVTEWLGDIPGGDSLLVTNEFDPAS